MFVYDVLDNGKVTKVDFDEIYEYVRRDKISKKQFREYISGLYSHVNGRLDTLTTLVNSVKVAHEMETANNTQYLSMVQTQVSDILANVDISFQTLEGSITDLEGKLANV